eukprot:TRINITY_DN1260_c0_g1_i1.p2 TRINITY_DN1260_c0_g1~~TRINITY_DN1260_c0_g1_i1.p2  ORF type:complete len:166 (+),score=20.72 TRINITY_DN1260_c0_g1_i1:765-1262(+)
MEFNSPLLKICMAMGPRPNHYILQRDDNSETIAPTNNYPFPSYSFLPPFFCLSSPSPLLSPPPFFPPLQSFLFPLFHPQRPSPSIVPPCLSLPPDLYFPTSLSKIPKFFKRIKIQQLSRHEPQKTQNPKEFSQITSSQTLHLTQLPPLRAPRKQFIPLFGFLCVY